MYDTLNLVASNALEETQRWQISSSSESKRKKENLTTQSVEIETLSCKLLVAWQDRLRYYTFDILVQKPVYAPLMTYIMAVSSTSCKQRDENKFLRIYSLIIRTFRAVKQPVFGYYRQIKNAVLVKAMCPRIALKRTLLVFNMVAKSLIKTNLLKNVDKAKNFRCYKVRHPLKAKIWCNPCKTGNLRKRSSWVVCEERLLKD